jgi:hypothetical protein
MSSEMAAANDVVQGYLSDFPAMIALFDRKLIDTFCYLPNSQKIFFRLFGRILRMVVSRNERGGQVEPR